MKRYYIINKEGLFIGLIFGATSHNPIGYGICNLQEHIADITYNLTDVVKDQLESKGLILNKID